jgi:predicted nuclease with RNAse H fold
MTAVPIIVGIDVAAARPCTLVAVRAGRTGQVAGWLETDNASQIVDWVDALQPAVVAIDAPQAFNRHLLISAKPGQRLGSLTVTADLPSSRSRVCDHELLTRRISVYQVPNRTDVESGGAKLPGWMQVGFALFKAFKKRRYELAAEGDMPGAFGQAPTVLEAFPHAAFVTLLGGIPPNKGTRAGAHVRVKALRDAQLEWDDYFDHDSLDALAAALTGWRYQQGRARALGDAREGLLWVPVGPAALKPKYEPLQPV